MPSADPAIIVQAVPTTEQPIAQEAPSTEQLPKVSTKKSAGSKSKKAKRSKSRNSSPSKQKSAEVKSGKKQSSKLSRGRASRRDHTPIGLEGAVDILSPVAMENVSYIAHEAQGALVFRGFAWPGARSKKKGKSSKGKRKR